MFFFTACKFLKFLEGEKKKKTLAFAFVSVSVSVFLPRVSFIEGNFFNFLFFTDFLSFMEENFLLGLAIEVALKTDVLVLSPAARWGHFSPHEPSGHLGSIENCLFQLELRVSMTYSQTFPTASALFFSPGLFCLLNGGRRKSKSFWRKIRSIGLFRGLVMY